MWPAQLDCACGPDEQGATPVASSPKASLMPDDDTKVLIVDATAFADVARMMDAALDQVPYAMANAMTHAAFETRRTLVEETWPSSVTVRNPGFIRAALRVEPAKKNDLVVEIYDQLNKSVKLKLHAEGGVKTAQSGMLAVPSSLNVTRTAHGVVAEQRPRNLVNSFRKGDRIYQRTPHPISMRKARKIGRRTAARIAMLPPETKARAKLMYVLKKQTRIRNDVPFYEVFAERMTDEMAKGFQDSMIRAMSTRRPR